MKKIIILLILSISSVNFTFGLEKAISNFDKGCFEYYYKIPDAEIKLNQVYKIKTDKEISKFSQNNKKGDIILNSKLFFSKGNNIKYNSELNFENLNDENEKTFDEITIKEPKTFLISFDEQLKRGNFDFNFQFESNYYYPYIYISNDGIHFSDIGKTNANEFSFKYLKIDFFKPSYQENKIENIKIKELSFKEKYNTYLIKKETPGDIEVFSDYKCKENFSINNDNNINFGIDNKTETLNIDLIKNSIFNPQDKKDSDKDGVFDDNDNCKTIYNPNQKDSNSDGIGDLCADDDNDGIIGEKDNCINISNPNQKDVNRNMVGDVCEFDKDNDGIFDSLDNCITTANPDQKDDDNDGIGNVCDNCKEYNPSQLDKNQDGIGDLCEDIKSNLEKNDIDKDGVEDSLDNCKNIPNPDKLDFDNDGVGDVCDNCKDIQNETQDDENKNKIGDICEDSDKDNIIGYKDNCINTANPDQKDDDNNGVGNVCEDKDNDNIVFEKDNCPFDYNLGQEDLDKDGLGDVCDKKDDRFIESNKTFFVILGVILAIAFIFSILSMIKKLDKLDKKD